MDIEEASPNMRNGLATTSDLRASIEPVSLNFEFDMSTISSVFELDSGLR
jgi:hypothetical protein